VQRLPDAAVVGLVPPGDGLPQGAGEEVGVVVRDQDPVADLIDRDGVEPDAAPGGLRLGEPAEPFDDRRGVCRPDADERGQQAGPHLDPGQRIPQNRRRGGRVHRRGRVGVIAGQVEQPGDPPGGDQCAGDVAAALDEGRHRDHQHGDVAVHGHEVADSDRALRGHPRGQPGDDRQEERRQAAGKRTDPARRSTDVVAGLAQRPGLMPVAGGVGALAAEAVEYPQPAQHVDQSGSQRTLPLAVRRAGAIDAAQQRPDRDGQQRHSGQQDDGDQRGDGQHDDGDHGVGHDRSEPGTGHGQ